MLRNLGLNQHVRLKNVQFDTLLISLCGFNYKNMFLILFGIKKNCTFVYVNF